jgi:hypothetical protein
MPCWLSTPALIPKESEVTKSAKQLATNSLLVSMFFDIIVGFGF